MAGNSSTRSAVRPRLVGLLLAVVLVATAFIPGLPVLGGPLPAAAAGSEPHIAGGFEYIKTFASAPAQCAYNGGFFSNFFVRGDCVRIDFSVTNTSTGSHTISVQLRSADGTTLVQTIAPTKLSGANNDWYATTPIDGAGNWPAGRIVVRVLADGQSAGEGGFFFNALGAVVNPGALASGDRYEPGEDIPLNGSISELNDLAANTQMTGVAAAFKIRVLDPEGDQLFLSPTLTANSDGTLPAGLKIPGSATAAVTATAEQNYQALLAIEVVDATYTDSGLTVELPPRAKGAFAGDPAGTGAVMLQDVPATLLLETLYASPTGWVKPGEEFPFRVFVSNYTNSARNNVTVTIPKPPSLTFVGVNPLGGAGSANTGGGNTVTWNIGTLAAATSGGPTVATLVVRARAATLAQDPEIVWKDLSSTARLTYTGGPAGLTSSTHGPKVIPPSDEYETARYGDKPFVMVPVDFTDRKHSADHTGDALARKVNSPATAGSTFNLYQEMSYGQLYPNGVVPSVGIGSRGFDYAPGFEFSTRDPLKPTCRGTTYGDLPQPVEEAVYGTPAYPERISDGWYQLPGDTEYYGGDFPAFTLGVGSTIDGACGPTSKSVYDAAVIADPEIDYNEFDLDKDGVVDFFMMVFAGIGGNAGSQTSVPPYDNIWPHSSSLEYYYTQQGTGLKGYVSDDQLKSLDGTPQCFTNATYTEHAACGAGGDSSKPVYVRVGPYNVNPEAAIDQASVIAHEYGHHLGLPDFYSTSYTTYNDWFLMASDYSQHMTIFGKQEMGWVVPDYLQPGETRNVPSWKEIKNDTGQIRWQTPGGQFYTLSAANGDQNIHNGHAFGLKLPRRMLIEKSQVEAQASLPNLFYSGRGNDFGCTPVAGHNLDIALPELATVPDGTTVTLTYKSKWDIEWDFDYGFTMVTTNGKDYTSLPSQNLYTTDKNINPNNSACLTTHNNGLTGTSGSYRDSTFAADRNPASPIYRDSPFLEDEYDLSPYAGEQGVVLRFSYYTDPGYDRPGWFIDDLVIRAGNQVIYSNDVTTDDQLHVYPGGCNADTGLHTADKCTDGWSMIDATSPSSLDHGYFLELRDRSGFDFNGRGQADRGAITWQPGALIEYTDESRGYGNIGDMPPRQHYLDSQPQNGLDCGEALTDDPLTPRDDTAKQCFDAAFTAAAGDKHFDDDPAAGEPGDWIDNFADASSDDGFWHFAYKCLSLDINSMSGTDVNETLPSNLTANATIKALAGCAPFSYTGNYPNAAPFADAQVKPGTGTTATNFIFDGSGSSDDLTPASQLIYQWDFDNNGTWDASGQVIARKFTSAGTKTVKLRVTDKSTPAKSAIDTITVVVTGAAAAKPDLTVTAHSVNKTTIRRGDQVTFTATIKNIGTVAAAATTTEWHRYTANGLTGRRLGFVATQALAPNQSRQVSLTINTSGWKPGRYRIRVYADIHDVVSEQPPNNNNGFYFYVTILRP